MLSHWFEYLINNICPLFSADLINIFQTIHWLILPFFRAISRIYMLE
jgi:hypothetical protein